MTSRQSPDLSPQQLHWLAGLLEGEGSFLKPPPSSPNNISVTVQMTDEDVIARVAGLIDASCHKCDGRGYKPTFRTTISGRRACDLMLRLRPLMGTRRQGQIDAALAKHNPRRRILSVGTRQEIVAEFTGGDKATDIAEKHGIAREHVYRIVRESRPLIKANHLLPLLSS
jgi:hypothetical protein